MVLVNGILTIFTPLENSKRPPSRGTQCYPVALLWIAYFPLDYKPYRAQAGFNPLKSSLLDCELKHSTLFWPWPIGRGMLRHGTVAHALAQAWLRNVDMKYNHVHYSAMHIQEIQQCERVFYDWKNTE